MGETRNVIDQHSEIVNELKASFTVFEKEIGVGTDFSDECRTSRSEVFPRKAKNWKEFSDNHPK